MRRTALATLLILAASAAWAGEVLLPLYNPFPPQPAPLGEYLIGSACAGSPAACELWAIDPLGHGSRQIADLPGTSSYAAASNFTRVGDHVLFIRGVVPNYWLWTTDGTTAGTRVIDVIVPQPCERSRPVVTNGAMVFVTWTDGVWRTDGTPAGTFKIGEGTIEHSDVVGVGGLAFFRTSADGQIWRTDGTLGGTTKVTNLEGGAFPDLGYGYTTAGNKLFFQGYEDAGLTQRALFATDGTQTVRLATVPGSLFRGGAIGSDAIIFESAQDAGFPGVNIWRSDGTADGTAMGLHLVVDIPFQDPDYVASAGSFVYFVSRNAAVNPGLWRTDGTVAGTTLVIAGDMSQPLVAIGDAVYVGANGGLKMVNDSGIVDVDPAGVPWAAANAGNKVLYATAGSNSPISVGDGTNGTTYPILSADGSPTIIGFTTGGVSVEESGATTISVQRVNSEGSAAVRWTTANGTAISGQHFGAAGDYGQVSGVLSWADGETGAKTITIGGASADVPIIDDAINQPSGHQFTINLSNVSPGASLGAGAATVSIVDDDSVVQLAVAATNVVEGKSLVLSVVRTGTSTEPVTAHWSLTPGTALPGVDYALPETGTVTWSATDTSAKTITIPILQNATPELDRQFTVNIASADNARIGARASALVTIKDDDKGAMFASIAREVPEGAGRVTLTVNRMGSMSMAATVRWTTSNGSAQAGSDFGTRNSLVQPGGTLSWMAGDATPKTIIIPILQDSLFEGPETFTVMLSNPVGLALGENATATVTILDDDIPLESNVSFAQPKILVVEGTPTADVVVHRESVGAGFTTDLAVSYSTVAGTAMATSDFTARTGTLNWAAGDSADKTIAIPVVNNSVAESPKSFKLRISTSSPGAQVTTPEATITILDDDELFPALGAIPDDWTMPAGADDGWHVSNDAGAYEGVYSLRSDAILDGQAAQVETTRNFAAGTITFRVKVSSEANFDVLRFYVDDVAKGSWSGTTVTGWQLFSMPITAGSHTLRWSYEKDGSASMGADAAWIDGVVLP